MKRILCLLLALCLLCTTAIAEKDLFAENQTDKAERTGHVVSVVFDDSSSMRYGNDAIYYAQHAMNCFLTMLDPDVDTLYVTFMSKSDTAVEIPLKQGVKSCEETIEQHIKDSGTPFSAVQTAMKALENHTGTPNDQYWLIVLTDGEFSLLNTSLNSMDDIPTEFKNFHAAQMPNGTLPSTCFVAIGKNAQKISPMDRLELYEATNAQEINTVIQSVANLISGCIPATNQVQNSTIEVTTQLPAYRIIIIDSGTGVSSAAADVGNQQLTCTMYQYDTIKETCEASVVIAQTTFLQLENAGSILPAGTYTIQCNGKLVQPVVMVEPALKINISAAISDDGNVEVNAGLSADGECETVDPALLPSNTTYLITATNEKGEVIASSDDPEMKLTISAIENTNITAQVLLGGTGAVMSQQILSYPVSLILQSTADSWEKQGDVLATYEIDYAGLDEHLANVQYDPVIDIPAEVSVSGRTLSVLALNDREDFTYLGSHTLQVKVSDEKLHTTDSDVTTITINMNQTEAAPVDVALINTSGQWLKAGDVIAAYQITYDGPDKYLDEVVFEAVSDVPVELERIGKELFVKTKEDRALFTKLGAHSIQIKVNHDKVITNDSTVDEAGITLSWIELLILIGGGLFLLLIVIGEASKRRFPKKSYISVAGVGVRGANATYPLDKFTMANLVPFVRSSRSIGDLKVYAASKNVVMLKRSDVPRCSTISPKMPSGGTNESDARPVFSGNPDEQKQKYLPLVAGETLFLTADHDTGSMITLHVKE